jgi:MFS transporter, PAT family, beta-lactamase induction signal transducer AmpG
MQTILNKRNLLITFLLGFSSGLPLALTAGTLQAWFTVTGVSIVAIGSLGLIGQPYVLKFLWAPLMDRWIPPLWGRRRGWLLITQLALLLAIAGMTLADPNLSPYLLVSLAFLVAFFSASQDIAVDAYRTDILTPEERGLGSTLYAWGYRIAMLISGGVALAIAQHYGWRTTYLLMASLMIVGLIATWFAETPITDKQTQHLEPFTWKAAVVYPFRDFLTRKSSILILIFILFYKLGDALSVSLTTPFLVRGLGFSLTTVAVVNKGIGFAATMAGLFIGGLLMTRISLWRSLFYFGWLQAAAILSLLQLSLMGHHYGLLVFTIALDNFCNALGSVAFVALLMSLCNPNYTATQFALLTAFASAGRVFIGPTAGIIASYFNWPTFFMISLLMCLPGLGLLWYLRRDIAPSLSFSANSLA